MIILPYKKIKRIAFVLIVVPCLLFFIGWLRWYWSILAILGMGMTFFLACKTEDEKTDERKDEIISFSKKTIIGMVIISIIWVWLSGIGGFWAQSSDHIFRNAIFRDIILKAWPVKYPATGHALVYYIGFWLFPALFGKLSLLFGASDVVAYNVGCVALYIWTVICIMTVFLLIVHTVRALDAKKQIFFVILFVFFSGTDLLGCIGQIELRGFHMEWWAVYYQYSSFTTCLFWVFNQAVPAWICVLLLLNEKKISNYVLLGMICLFNAPLPFVGFFIIAVVRAIVRGVKKIKGKKTKELFKEVLSASNIVSTLIIFPIFATYLLSNTAIHGTGSFQFQSRAFNGVKVTNDFGVDLTREGTEHESDTELNNIENSVLSESQVETKEPKSFLSMLSSYFSFICFEFLFYMIFIYKKYKKDYMYYVVLVCLLAFPLLRIGGASDFAMRASIPCLLVLYLMVGRFLAEERSVLKEKKSVNRLCYIALLIILFIGAITPGMEIFRVSRQAIQDGIRTEAEDCVYTLGCDGPYDPPGKYYVYENFVSVNLDEHAFFKVFCK